LSPLFGLDEFPVAEDLGGVFGAFFAEDVRVATYHFFVDFTDDIGDGETGFLAGDLGMKENLKQEVTQFLRELSVIGGIERVEYFVGFLNEVGAERSVGLLAIPRATARGAETRHNSYKFVEGRTNARRRCGVWFAASRRFVPTRMFAVRLAWHVVDNTLAGFALRCRRQAGEKTIEMVPLGGTPKKPPPPAKEAATCQGDGEVGSILGFWRTAKAPARAKNLIKSTRIEGRSGVTSGEHRTVGDAR
jgi:hypothetical protein